MVALHKNSLPYPLWVRDFYCIRKLWLCSQWEKAREWEWDCEITYKLSTVALKVDFTSSVTWRQPAWSRQVWGWQNSGISEYFVESKMRLPFSELTSWSLCRGWHNPGCLPSCVCMELSQREDDSAADHLPAMRKNPVVQWSLMFSCQIGKYFFFFCRHHYILAIKFLLCEP